MNRLKMDMPVIGIRPCIDGRRKDDTVHGNHIGQRESLEGKTMAMAESAKKLIQDNLKYPDGSEIKVVIADTTIGRVAEAAACQKKFEREGVQITLTVSPCWCYSTEVTDMDPHTIKAIWGFNGTDRPGAVFLAAALAASAQKGLPMFGIYGHDVQDLEDNTIPADVQEKILRFARCAIAAKAPRGNSYLQVGSMCMGIGGSVLDQEMLQEYFGLRSESVDQSEILRRVQKGIYDHEEYEKALAWTKANCIEGMDPNPEDIQWPADKKAEQWEFMVKCMIIVRDLMIGNPKLAELGFVEEAAGHNAIVGGVQGQRQWTDFMPNYDFTEALMCSQFDWNGIRESFVVATENDTLNGLTMLMEHLLTGTPGIFADVRTYWSPEAVKRVSGKELEGKAANGIIHLVNSGAAALEGTGAMKDADGNYCIKPSYEMTEEDVKACLDNTRWCSADLFNFRGGGFSTQFVGGSKGNMPVTMVRLNVVKGLGPVLQLAEGWTCELDPDVHAALDNRTNPTWPTTWFAPRLTGKGAFKDVYGVMANWGANHGAFVYGHVGADIITLCSMLRIPVCMHNVDEENIFRPSAWAAFGTDDLTGADYRACAVYGPMYK